MVTRSYLHCSPSQGFLVGTVLKLGVCFAMLGLFALAFIAN